jgi:hypothetical protein
METSMESLNVPLVNLESINVIDGNTGSRLDKLLQYCARIQRENHSHRKIITDAFESGRSLTSGFIVARRQHSLNNCDILEGIRKRKRKQENGTKIR